jgi:tRNA-specific 2-thiouridylase
LENKLPTATRKESQDICFLDGQKVSEFLKNYIPPKAGFFIYKNKVVGRHEGYFAFTVGQRRGLGLRLGKPVYVIDIDAEKNAVIVGDREELATRRVRLERLTIFVPPQFWDNLYGQIRYRTPSQRVEGFEFSDGVLDLWFEKPFYGVAKGQIGALYINDEILAAGGIIS